MARGRGHTAPIALTPRPGRHPLPLDRERIGTSGRWEDHLRADRPSSEILATINAGFRFPEGVDIGVYSNGREQGLRFSRPAAGADPGFTVWVAEYRTSDNIVIYTLDAESDLASFALAPAERAEAIYEHKLMLKYDEVPRAAAMIREWMGALPLSHFAPVPERPRDLGGILRAPRGRA